jgi:hypothetical protein
VTRPRCLALTDRQMRMVQQHAAALQLQLRDVFLRQIGNQLTGEPSDFAVEAAVNAALDRIYAIGNNTCN